MTKPARTVRPPDIARVTFENGTPVVDAAVIAPLLGLDLATFRHGMKTGAISTRLERGEGSDEGKMRLIFQSAHLRLRLTCDTAGNVLSVSRAQRGSGQVA